MRLPAVTDETVQAHMEAEHCPVVHPNEPCRLLGDDWTDSHTAHHQHGVQRHVHERVSA